ncbi:Oidioi.mRNA.OKI2018_I69.chr1.g3465.t1.cds [Oikopleura dioica]|uniref:Oidioi.mRNA.OKI2018_I69.chr1.g3465.t1.cds n=1 Tax=Oikopleura dioica TaxID=34765 RepID=A0ABN7SVX4_OIKDI|nr:Oidioi.mRNA.OKI2018_I69.chr1.g3465.t1.cds [Oikopleura dioica]
MYEESKMNASLRGSRTMELPDVVNLVRSETGSIYEWVESNIRESSNSRRVLSALNKFEQKFEGIFNQYGVLLCKTKDSSRISFLGFFDDLVEGRDGDSYNDDDEHIGISPGRGLAPLPRFEQTSNQHGSSEFSEKYASLKPILERIRDTITKFTSACAKHDNFLERVQKIENRGINALLDEMMSSE